MRLRIRKFAFGLISLTALTLAASASAQNVPLAGHRSEAVARLPQLGPMPANSILQMEIDLQPQNRAALDQLVAEQQDPNSPNYQKWLTPEEFDRRFGVSQQAFDDLLQWLSSQGFHIGDANRAARYVRFSGMVSQAESAFGRSWCWRRLTPCHRTRNQRRPRWPCRPPARSSSFIPTR